MSHKKVFVYHPTKDADEFFKKGDINKPAKENKFTLSQHQKLLKSFMSQESPYKNLLIIHGTGSGMTISSCRPICNY